MKNFRIKDLFVGSLISSVVSLLMCVGVAVVLTILYENETVSIQTVRWIGIIVNSACVFVGVWAGKAKRSVPGILLCGASVVMYIVMLVILNIAVFKSTSIHMLYHVLAVIVGGVIALMQMTRKKRYVAR